MKKINRLQKRALDRALQSWSCRSKVSVYTISDSFDLEELLEYGVNWSCRGTVPAKEAKEYAEALSCAAEMAETLNKLEITSVWTELPNIDKQQYLDHVKSLETALELCDAEVICHVLDEIDGLCK